MQNEDRIHLLDGLRGFFAFCVLAYHYVTWSELPVGDTVYGLLDRTAIYAVCGFFVLSGASMAIAYRARPPTNVSSFISYLVQRFFRIAPLYYAVLAIHVVAKVASCVRGGECDVAIADLASNIFFTFGFGEAAQHSMVVAGWSIGIEWVFYLLFPAMLVAGAHSIFSATAMVALCAIALLLWDWSYISSGPSTWPHYAQFPAYAVYFSIGIIIGLYRRRTDLSWLVFSSALALYVLLHYASGKFNVNLSFAGPWALVFGLLTCTFVWAAATAYLPAWGNGICKVAGQISYPVYLLHFPVFMGMSLAGLNEASTVALSTFAVVALSFASWHLYERPFVRLGRAVAEQIRKRPARAS